jgi:hypothetical protein
MKCMNRKAVTLIEVIFSIGVVLIGLLGLLSLMPLAGKRSQEAISLAAAAAVGDSVMNELLSRKPISNQLLSDMSSTPGGAAYDTRITLVASQYGSRQIRLPRLRVGANAIFEGICIDSLYKGLNGTAVAPGNKYNDTFFPYFVQNYNPLINPSTNNASNDWPLSVSTAPSPPQARMRRVGLDTLNTLTVAQRLEQSRIQVESVDDLVASRPKDRSVDAVIDGLSTGLITYGRRAPSGEFSWIATISALPGSRYASVSVVVLRRRDAERDFPQNDGSVPVETPRENGIGERLAYVTSFAGFQGGAGGQVRLAASATTSSSLRSNDWIMLSRRVQHGSDNEVHVHRWYRVVATDPEPRILVPDGSATTADTQLGCFLPNSVSTPVWVRDVILDGPDWNFGFSGDATGDFEDNTFATIMTDVVSVTERVVPLSSL